MKTHKKIQTQPQSNQCYQTLGKPGSMTRVFQRNLFCMEANFKHFSSLPDDLILDEPMKDFRDAQITSQVAHRICSAETTPG